MISIIDVGYSYGRRCGKAKMCRKFNFDARHNLSVGSFILLYHIPKVHDTQKIIVGREKPGRMNQFIFPFMNALFPEMSLVNIRADVILVLCMKVLKDVQEFFGNACLLSVGEI